MTGSHTYASGSRHTITTSVSESGNSPVSKAGNKIDDQRPGTGSWADQDVVHLPQNSEGSGDRGASSTRQVGSGTPAFVVAVTLSPQQQATDNAVPPAANIAPWDTDRFFGLADLMLYLPQSKRSHSLADWFAESWSAASGE